MKFDKACSTSIDQHHPNDDGLASTFLEAKAINKTFSGRNKKQIDVLKDINFKIPKHGINVLLGPSGCGKSTLLNLIAGLETPSSGEIVINDKLIRGPGRDRGMVFQNYTCYPWLTVRQNVEYGLKLHGDRISLAEGTASYFLDRVKLGGFEDVYPERLSGGMRQRLAIARALAVYPDMLLMDEPFGALDAITRWRMQELLLEIIDREKITVFMVTHDIDEALFLGDRIFFMSINPGTIKEVLVPSFHDQGRLKTKEALFDHIDYRHFERHVMSLMRCEEI